jgi:hypothetical protein
VRLTPGPIAPDATLAPFSDVWPSQCFFPGASPTQLVNWRPNRVAVPSRQLDGARDRPRPGEPAVGLIGMTSKSRDETGASFTLAASIGGVAATNARLPGREVTRLAEARGSSTAGDPITREEANDA